MLRLLSLLYGTVAYAVFAASFLYMVGFLGNLVVPRTVDVGGPQGPLAVAIAVDLLLIGAFTLQHSVMARLGFKRWVTGWMPEHLERSTFVLLAGVVLLGVFWLWRPIPIVVWDLGDGAAATASRAVFWLAWLTVLVSSFLIDHPKLFGLRQVWQRERSRGDVPLQTTGLYRYVRHPLMSGFLVAMWVTPEMTAGHLLFAAAMTAYGVAATLLLEERDLVRQHGEAYRAYQRRVPAILPRPGRRTRPEPAVDTKPAE